MHTHNRNIYIWRRRFGFWRFGFWRFGFWRFGVLGFGVLGFGVFGFGVLGFGSREPENIKPTNHFEIHNSSFINNKAQFGSAIQINRDYFDSITVGSIFTLVLNIVAIMIWT